MDYEATFREGLMARFSNQQKAKELLEKCAIPKSPTFKKALYELSIIYLEEGNFKKGFECFEHRIELSPSKFNERTLFYKDSLFSKNKTILIPREQGLGDMILFIRYLPLLDKMFNDYIIEVPYNPFLNWNDPITEPPSLRYLYSLYKPKKMIIAGYTKMPEFDYWLPLMSCAYFFKTTINTIPKIPKFFEALNNQNGKIGYVYTGAQTMPNNHARSIAKKFFIDLENEFKNTEFINLQPGEGPVTLNFTLEDTIDYIENLDLILTVDTFMAHLAGFFNLKTYLLSQYYPGWRWAHDKNNMSLWYPSVEVFKQDNFKDWKSVLEKICFRLKKDGYT